MRYYCSYRRSSAKTDFNDYEARRLATAEIMDCIIPRLLEVGT